MFNITTIYDIAKKTGFSKSTISRVTSGNGYVSSEKRQIILNAMQELNYTPNQVAKNLRNCKTQTIGFLSADYFPLMGEFINIFNSMAASYNYNTTVFFTKNAKNEQKILESLANHLLDAAFILTRINEWDLINSYTQFAPIATWQRVKNTNIYSNYVDHYPIYFKILEKLYNKGFERVGHVFSLERNENTKARIQAIKDFSLQHQASDHSYQLFYGQQSHAGQDVAQKWLAQKNRPTAMIFYSDYVAAQFISALRLNQVKVPEDCFVIGSDDSEIARLMNIPTVDFCFRSQAKNGFIYLYNQLNQKNLPFVPQVPKFIYQKI
ncbi:LacI family DNA-binding transcriptional regulator [Xylocopilactobacillus apicola]|uniref:LacI family transcriptional regulator n=1 Tax=Xylocopilactobacillus apicola TaxID=2932184 RepID=A0AAU9DCL7_9LACO|nr:LacI family DNA-binding transcriptional regulator [Xylocopilactobacillus apicola]BDR59305.1 LacI family transcriptional regulator [Xylocopilactobacillus apicola]